MWQRVQTIFLAVTVACLVAMIFFPIWEVKTETTRLTLYPLYYRAQLGDAISEIYFPYCVTAILALAAATIALIEIQKFENRLLQMKLGALNSLFISGCGFAAVFFFIKLQKAAQAQGNLGLALYLPFAALLLNSVANRFIRKDEKLVKDSERLR
jgi:glucan phosphoethanolaminetransferase (alkaline phosphatase superfamily)